MTSTTRKRLLILLAATTLTVGGIGGAFYYRGVQATQRLTQARAEGMALYTQGRYADALGQLSKYITRNQSDKQALIAYGRSRALTPEPDGRHVTEGIAVLRRYLDMSPADREASKLLLDLYTQAGYGTEAITLADRMLSENPRDSDALRARYIAQGRLRRFDEALAGAKTYLELHPTDLAAHWDVMDVLFFQGVAPNEYRRHAEAYLPRFPEGDPRASLLLARAAAHENQREETEKRLRDACASALKTPADPGPSSFTLDKEFVTRAADMFDRLSRFAEGQRFVEAAARVRPDDRDLAEALAARLWASGSIDAVVERTEGLRPEDRAAPTSLLALRALSLLQSGDREAGLKLADGLAARSNDTVAVAWALALRTAYAGDDRTALVRQRDYHAALTRLGSPGDPTASAVFRHLLGRAYREVGEIDLALSQWQQAVELLPQWSLPYRELCAVLSEQGNFTDARAYAERLYKRSPTVGHLILLGDLSARQLAATPDAQLASRMVKELADAIRQAPDEKGLIPPLVSALLGAGKREEALRLARVTLADVSTPPEVVRRLAADAESAGLGLDEEVAAARSRAGLGPEESSDLLFSRAMRWAASGQRDRAVALLEDAGGKLPGPSGQLLLIRFLDETNDPAALDRLRSFVNNHPSLLEGHLAVLASRSAWRDRDLVAASIDQVKRMTGESGITWRVARARMLVVTPDGSEPGDRESAEAVVLLNGVIRDAPRMVAPRLLLAKALRAVNTESAMAQFAAASTLAPDAPAIAIELARMQIAQGKRQEARNSINRVLESQGVTLGQRVALAELLAGLGENARAISLLRDPGDRAAPRLAPPPHEADLAARDATLARLLARNPERWPEATELFNRLLSTANPGIDVVVDAATFYAQSGDIDTARNALDRAMQGRPPDMAAVIRADFEEKAGEYDLALEILRRAVADSPTPELYARLAGLELRLARYDDAARAIAAGLAIHPRDASLQNLDLARETLERFKGRLDLQSLIAWVSSDPNMPGAMPTLEVLRQSSGQDTIARLRQLTRDFPGFLPAHAMLIQSHIDSGRRLDAAEAAASCFTAMPGNPDAASVVTAAYLAVGRPQEALGIARLWRQFTAEDPLKADLAVAACQLELRDAESALVTLRPYWKKPRPVVMLLTTRAFVISGHTSDARSLARQIWTSQPAMRGAMLADLVGAIPKSPLGASARPPAIRTALAVVDDLATLPDPTDSEQLLLAQAYHRIALADSSSGGFEKSEAILARIESLSERQRLPSAARLLWGEVRRHMGDLAGAERQYRLALSIDVDSAIAANNLADVLLSHSPDPARVREALELARRAVATRAGVAEFHDTLARAHRLAGDTQAALASFRESLALMPDRLTTLVSYATLLVELGHARDAHALLRQIEPLVTPANHATIEKELDSLRASVNGIAGTP